MARAFSRLTMFHMLSAFDLKPGQTPARIDRSLATLSKELVGMGLLSAAGALGRRVRHPVMDTDDERDHEYFFIMHFEDRAQCDRAVAWMEAGGEPGASAHGDIRAALANAVFICWQDV